MSALWVGVDLGTQSVKVQIVDGTGTVHAASGRPLTSVRDGVRHEQDPLEWVDAVAAAMAEAVASVDASRIAAVATCATSGTIAVLGADGRPTRPAIMYDDTRAAGYSEPVAEADPARWARLGYRIQPAWAVCTLAWLADTGALAGARAVHQGDVVVEAMAGHAVASDWSSALKSGYDLLALEWPAAAFERLGIPVGALPDIVGPGTPIGVTNVAWQERTGLPAGTVIIAGMTDGCAAQLGAGALGVGDWHSVIGTTLVLKGVSTAIVTDATGAVYSHRAPHGSYWLPGGASSVGAGVISTLLPGAELATLSAAVPALVRAGIPVAYPLVGRGERFPLVLPAAEGFFAESRPAASALPLAHLAERGPEAALATLFAGVACVERLCFDLLAARGARLSGRLSSSGGGTRSPEWTALRASLLGRPIALPASSEGSLGMAILAAWGHGGAEELPAVARRMSRIAATVEPDATLTAPLEELYGRFADALTTQGWT